MKSLSVNFLTLVLCILSVIARADTLQEKISILGLKSAYAPREVIQFEIENRSVVTQQFMCRIEWRDGNGQWQVLPNRIEDGKPIKDGKLYKLRSNKAKTFSWNPESIIPFLPSDAGNRQHSLAGKYRFAVHVLTGERTATIALSNEFTYGM